MNVGTNMLKKFLFKSCFLSKYARIIYNSKYLFLIIDISFCYCYTRNCYVLLKYFIYTYIFILEHPGKCYIQSTGVAYLLGESWQVPEMGCADATCYRSGSENKYLVAYQTLVTKYIHTSYDILHNFNKRLIYMFDKISTL